MEDVVEFTGWLSSAEVHSVLASATLGLQPDPKNSMSDHSTMVKTVEYLANGLPVLATDLLETRRTAGEAARYVSVGVPSEFARAIVNLCDDGAARARMSVVGRERFDTLLAWEHQERRYVSVMSALAAR